MDIDSYEISPLLLFALFNGKSNDNNVYTLHKSDFITEAPRPDLWVGHLLGLNPERSTKGWIGRTDTIGTLWPNLLHECFDAKLLSPAIFENWIGKGITGDNQLHKHTLKTLIEDFLVPRDQVPAMLLVHQICWRDAQYQRLHLTNDLKPRDVRAPVPYAYREPVRLQRTPDGSDAIVFSPANFGRYWHIPSGLSAMQLGFLKRPTSSTIKHGPRTVAHTYTERLAVGHPSATDCQFWQAAGTVIACSGLAYYIAKYPNGNLGLEMFDHETLITYPRIRPAVLNVQLIKFIRLVTDGLPIEGDDAEQQELILAFERQEGELVYLSLCTTIASTTNEQVNPSDWGQWLINTPQMLSRAIDSSRLIF